MRNRIGALLSTVSATSTIVESLALPNGHCHCTRQMFVCCSRPQAFQSPLMVQLIAQLQLPDSLDHVLLEQRMFHYRLILFVILKSPKHRATNVILALGPVFVAGAR